MITLDNGTLKVEIDPLGAEIQSVIKNNYNYIREKNLEFWNRYTPVLFPIVGKLENDQYFVDGKKFEMTQHGFARDMEFEVIYSDANSATFLLSSNSETLKKYPYNFNFYITHEIDGNDLTTSYRVENKNNHDMYYSVGAHPGFRVEKDHSYNIITTSSAMKYDFEDGLITGHEKVEHMDIMFDYTEFKDDAIILDLDEKELNILKDGENYMRFTMHNLPLVGIWAPYHKDVDFVCIEPWSGIADYVDNDSRELKDKHFINKISKDEIKDHSFTTSFLEKK